MDLTPTSELEAINTLLAAIGESPVNTVDDSGLVDAVMARTQLRTTSRAVQTKGWHWNTLPSITLPCTYPDNEIAIPANTLRVDSVDEDVDLDVVQRGLRLFDRRKASFSFDKSVKVELVEFLDFESLPEAARSYITMSAMRKYQEDRVGSETLGSFNKRDELKAWADLINDEAETTDANVLSDNYSVMRVLNR